MRTWLCVAALLILPLLVYWPTVTHEYGFRDDYAHLREVRERPGWLMTLTTSHGRPVYGAPLEASLQPSTGWRSSRICASISAVLIGVVGVLLVVAAAAFRLDRVQAAAIGAAVTLLPGAQVVVGWAIAWPVALGLVAALAGFALVGAAASRRRARARRRSLRQAACSTSIAGPTYQTSALFAVVPLVAAAAAARRHDDAARCVVDDGAHRSAVRARWSPVSSRRARSYTPGAVPEAARIAPRARHLAEIALVPAQPAAELDRRCSRCATASRRRSGSGSSSQASWPSW